MTQHTERQVLIPIHVYGARPHVPALGSARLEAERDTYDHGPVRILVKDGKPAAQGGAKRD